MRRTFPVAVYAAMLGGTVGGQFLGMAVDTLALGRRILWVPLACSVVLEALVGARFGASRMGHPLSPAERLRLSLHYSLGLAGLSIPLVLWLAASHASAEQLAAGGGASPHDVLVAAGGVLLVLVACTLARTGLMALFAGEARVISTVVQAFFLAMGAVARNKTRATLTVLGILIGITAVVVVSALAESTSAQIGGQIDSFAANALYVEPRPVQASGARAKSVGRLTEADGRAIAREAVSVSGVAPWLSTSGQVVFGDRNWQTQIIGTTLPYYPIRRWVIGRGANWTESDEVLKTKVCVIGATVAKNLFGTMDPVGQTLRIGRTPYTVAGVLGARGTSLFGDDQDDRVMMPIGSFRARVMHTSPGRVDQLIVGATSDQVVGNASEQIATILRQRHHLEEGRDDFEVNTQAEMRETTDEILGTLSLLGIAVAGISLLVGGVGVMNIMLVSVAERTREIGIRMSIGARARDILVQFLVEAVVLTLVGGVLGILLGSGAAIGLGRAFDWPMAPGGSAIAVAALTSVAIGTVFGFLPAWRAAQLDPIAALRVE